MYQTDLLPVGNIPKLTYTHMDAQKKRGILPLLEFPDIQILYHSYLCPLDFSFSARSRSASSASIERMIAIL